MYSAKTSLAIVALVACSALAVQAAGIKGHNLDESQARPSGIKGPRPQQPLLPLAPPQLPQPVPLPLALPIPQRPQPVPQAPIKGPGQVSPLFSAKRPQQPIAQQQLVQQIVPLPAAPQPIVQQQQEPEAQQQESEVDPSGAAQDSAPALTLPAANGQASSAVAASEEEANPRPEPYSFQYAYDAGDSVTSGSSQREETQDASGKVTGFYTLRGEDGRDRRVDYVADASGFRATITTNELGTAPKDSADVDWQAQSPSDAQIRAADSATQAARQRAQFNPQPAGSGQLSKISSPRQNAVNPVQAASTNNFKNVQQIQQASEPISQLQEPFEQIRQTEFNSRARKSRHAPFYLFTM